MLTEKFDRGVSSPEFTADSSAITFWCPMSPRISREKFRSPAAPAVERMSRLGPIPAGRFPTIQCRRPYRRSGVQRQLRTRNLRAGNRQTSQNYFAQRRVSLRDSARRCAGLSFKSKDGTEIHGMMIKPPTYDSAKKYPTLLWIHGGPNGQDDHALPFSTLPPTTRAPDFRRAWLRSPGHQLSRQQRTRRGIHSAASLPTGAIRKSRTCWPQWILQ